MVACEHSPATPQLALRPHPTPRTLALVICGPIGRADLLGLCERVRVLLAPHPADLVVCDVGAVANPDAVTVDALARVQLALQRTGRRLQLRHACAELQDLLDLMGLTEAVPLSED